MRFHDDRTVVKIKKAFPFRFDQIHSVRVSPNTYENCTPINRRVPITIAVHLVFVLKYRFWADCAAKRRTCHANTSTVIE